MKGRKMPDMRTMRAIRIAPLTLGVIALCLGTCMGGSAESRGSKISGFVIGHSGFVWNDPFRLLFMRDPLFTYSLYPLPPDIPDDDKRKLDRVYYPRTREILIDSYDLMVFHDARIQHFTSRQIHDLDHAFREGGMTSVMVFMGSFLWDWVWEPTILREVAPISHHVNARFAGYRVSFRRERDPVLLPFVEFGIEEVVGTAVAEMDVKQGATIWGDIRPQNQPWLVSWEPGGGNPGMQWTDENNNPNAMDVATNMILHSLDMPLIVDILARREARRLFTSLQSQKSVILSMLEWADTFGANTLVLSERLSDMENEIQVAVGDYMEQDYVAAISFLESVSPTVGEIAKDAVGLKDEVLFWVYLVEWFGVTGVGLVSGFLALTLMIRRKLYREVDVTRLVKETESG
jgi:hypothetical protein